MVRWNTRFRKGNHSGHSRASHLHAWPFPWLVHNIRQIWTTVNIFHTITTTSFILTSLDALVPENPTVYHTRREAPFPAMISHPNNKQQGINFETLAMQTGHLKTSQSVQLQGKLGHAGLKLHRGQACSQTSLLNVCSQIWLQHIYHNSHFWLHFPSFIDIQGAGDYRDGFIERLSLQVPQASSEEENLGCHLVLWNWLSVQIKKGTLELQPRDRISFVKKHMYRYVSMDFIQGSWFNVELRSGRLGGPTRPQCSLQQWKQMTGRMS